MTIANGVDIETRELIALRVDKEGKVRLAPEDIEAIVNRIIERLKDDRR